MNRPDLYKKTVDTLFESYFNGTLRHGKCDACAVGNICKEAAMKTGISNHFWKHFFITETTIIGNSIKQIQIINEYKRWTRPATAIAVKEGATKLIKATGYKIKELAKIENTFETADRGQSNEDYMFNGLVSVLEVLKQIHEVQDNEADLQKFTTHYNTKRQLV